MPRIARGQLDRGIFHVLNRGNYRQMLFRQSEEFVGFLDLLGGSVSKFAVKVWGYCLMGNHWRLVVEVENIKDLSAWMHWLCNRQVRLAHRENAALGGGHIYQGRYKKLLHPGRGLPVQRAALRGGQPVASKTRVASASLALVEPVHASDLFWSGGGGASKAGSMDARLLLAGGGQSVTALDQLDYLRRSVMRGTPQGDPQWISALVTAAGMESTTRPRGRPAETSRQGRKT